MLESDKHTSNHLVIHSTNTRLVRHIEARLAVMRWHPSITKSRNALAFEQIK
jgi:hypothetical protein